MFPRHHLVGRIWSQDEKAEPFRTVRRQSRNTRDILELSMQTVL